MKRTNEYRCTRNDPYTNPTCLGHSDISARQGYYIAADTITEAHDHMRERFPEDMLGFTVQLWKVGIPTYTTVSKATRG